MRVTRMLEGRIVRELPSIAEHERADLIVRGTHDPGPVERFFVGSVAAAVLHDTPAVSWCRRPAPV